MNEARLDKRIDLQLVENHLKDIFNILQLEQPLILSAEDVNEAFLRIKEILRGRKNLKDKLIKTKSDNKTILVVDDMKFITYQVQLILSKEGFEVDACNSIECAIEKIKRKHYDFAIIDYFVPTKEDGLYLMKAIKLLTDTSTKMIAMSVVNKKQYAPLLLDLGIDCFIDKSEDWQTQLLEFCKPKDEFPFIRQ